MLRSGLLGLLLVTGLVRNDCSADGAVRLGPPPSSYRPMRCALSDSPAESLSAEPTYLGTPLYGAIHLGDGDDSTYSIAVDLAPDWAGFRHAFKDAQSKVDMASVPARIYVDANNDENLANDAKGLLTRCTDSSETPGSFTISGGAKCVVRYADGRRLGYPINLYMFPQRPKVKERDGSELYYARTLLYYRDASFQTRLPVAGAKLRVRFYDQNTDALMVTDDKDQFAIDLNQDRVLDTNPRGPEMYALDEAFHFGGESYVLKTFGPRGDRPRAAVSERKVEAPLYILKGGPAPDFTMPTLDGGTFTLSEQKGRVVVLDFWATWCGPCREELPNVVRMWDDLKDEGLVLVGVSLDTDDDQGKATDKVAKLASERGMGWTHIIDGGGGPVGNLYQVWSIPHTVLIGRDGKVVGMDLGGKELHEGAKKALGGT